MRITIGSPIYERPEPAMVTCLIATLDLLRERGHVADWRYVSAVVHVARNHLMADMMQHDPDVFVQIDADHQFEASDLVDAIEAAGEGLVDVIGFCHLDRKPPSAHEPPRWVSPTVHHAARPGFLHADKHYIEVDGVGGGILICSRSCVKRLSETAERDKEGTLLFFDFATVDGERLGEDVYFCRRWRAMGGKIHCDVTSLIGHIGSRVYAMNPARLSALLEFEAGDE